MSPPPKLAPKKNKKKTVCWISQWRQRDLESILAHSTFMRLRNMSLKTEVETYLVRHTYLPIGPGEL